jgi:hypothetical protein
MGDTITTYSSMLKQYYDDDKVFNLIYDKNPLLTMVEKDEGFVGEAYKVPVIYAGAQGIGQDFTIAQAQSVASSQGVAAFLVSSRAHMYGFTNWSRETMLASANNTGAFMSVAKVAVENCLRGLGNQLATALYRSGYGDCGTIATGFSASGTSIALANPEDIVNFEKGMRIVVSSTQAGALRTLGSSGLGILISGVNRSTGVLTLANAANDATNGIPAIAAGDFIVVQGNRTSTTALLPYGVEAWLPATAPTTGDSFWGVDRSVDTRLSGQRLNATDGRPLEEALIEAAQLVAREGGQLSHFFMGFGTYAKLLKQMQGRVLLTDVETDTGIGFRGATIQTPTGEVLVVPDRTCPGNRVFGLELSTWSLASLGKLVAPVEEDGLMILRSSTADTFESRYATYSQLVCKAPARNINVQVPIT